MLFTRVSGEDRAPGPLRGTVGSQSPSPPRPTSTAGVALSPCPAPQQAVGPVPVDHSEVGRSVPFRISGELDSLNLTVNLR